MTEFLFMLTHHDRTVDDALSVYKQVRNTGLRFVGFKDVGLGLSELKELANAIRDGGQKVVLEVVSPVKAEELSAARNAIELSVDYLLGGIHPTEILEIIKGTGIKYFPFPGKVIGHPSLLRGTIEEIAGSARDLAAMNGVQGLDLLAYRHDGDIERLMKAVVDAAGIPVVMAGSINSDERIRIVKATGAWGFTIGSALFDGTYLPGTQYTLVDRIKHVLEVAG